MISSIGHWQNIAYIVRSLKKNCKCCQSLIKIMNLSVTCCKKSRVSVNHLWQKKIACQLVVGKYRKFHQSWQKILNLLIRCWTELQVSSTARGKKITDFTNWRLEKKKMQIYHSIAEKVSLSSYIGSKILRKSSIAHPFKKSQISSITHDNKFCPSVTENMSLISSISCWKVLQNTSISYGKIFRNL